MYKFNKAYDIILEDIIQSVSPEELKERQAEYAKIQFKLLFDKLFKEGRMIKKSNGSYDIEGNVNMNSMGYRSFKDIPYALNKINGGFYCSYNNLTSLEGCPKIINGNFYCYDNDLVSLEGCPEIVKGNFNCSYNKLMTMEGCTKTVNGDFYCSDNILTSLKGCPTHIYESFYCSYNQLTSLEGCPKTVDLDFYCFDNLKRLTEEDVRKYCVVKRNIHV